jgi:hypothetical protein
MPSSKFDHGDLIGVIIIIVVIVLLFLELEDSSTSQIVWKASANQKSK